MSIVCDVNRLGITEFCGQHNLEELVKKKDETLKRGAKERSRTLNKITGRNTKFDPKV